jgi:hypothetical protein
MIASPHFLLLVFFGLLLYPCLLQAQFGINSPVGVSPTQDLEIYTRNGFLVQQKYQYANADPNASVNNLSCVSNPPNLTALAGILKDPVGDANYTVGQVYSCAQAINISQNNIVGIELVFEDLDTQLTSDYVAIIDQNGYEQRFSGSTLPGRLIVPYSYVTIRFVTNSDANVGRGFRLRWHALAQETITAPTSIAFGKSMQFDASNASFNVGAYNRASGFTSTAMGGNNTASGEYSTAMGGNNTASGGASTAMGNINKASGSTSTAMGANNTASGDYSMAIGNINTASGEYSTAMGALMDTNTKRGAFMMGDADPLGQGKTISGVTDQFVARFLNGYFLLTSGNVSPGGGTYGDVRTGVIISRGQNSWGSISDSTKKERFQPINHPSLLRKIGAMKLTTWNYKGQHQIRHYGPMAQDFYAAFGQDGLGQVGCDTLIYSHDFAGVTFAGVQALIQENEQLKSRLATQETEKQRIEARLTETEARLNEVVDLRSRLDALERRWLTPSSSVSTATQSDTRQKSN